MQAGGKANLQGLVNHFFPLLKKQMTDYFACIHLVQSSSLCLLYR